MYFFQHKMYREVDFMLKVLAEITIAVVCVYVGYTLLHDICRWLEHKLLYRENKKEQKTKKRKYK